MMKENLPTLSFPKRFFWGASTSAHQVEGGNHNQWSVWELEHAAQLARNTNQIATTTPVWPDIEQQATDPGNYISGKACDHYHLYKEDFARAKGLNLNAFRFSIEWSRIEPEEGAWNAEAIQHYRDYLRALKGKNLEPFVTLWHWTVPVWFEQKGGFAKRRNVRYFLRFVQKVLDELGKEFRYIITLNEPDTYMAQGYALGNWPPQKKSKLTALWVYLNLAYAHKKVYALARATSRRFIIGLAKNSAYYYAGDDAIISRWSAAVAAWAADYFFLDQIQKQLDFIGLNYYFSNRFYGYRVHNPNQRLSDLGWDMQPQLIQNVLEQLYQRYGLPIIVTENGCADHRDEFRKWWIGQTLVAMHKALQNGVKLEGYLHWSLVDNFEWAYGFWPRFGLLGVDYATMQRTPRQSALWLAKTIKQLKS